LIGFGFSFDEKDRRRRRRDPWIAAGSLIGIVIAALIFCLMR
jgi:hypothetical protein